MQVQDLISRLWDQSQALRFQVSHYHNILRNKLSTHYTSLHMSQTYCMCLSKSVLGRVHKYIQYSSIAGTFCLNDITVVITSPVAKHFLAVIR